MTNIEKIFDFLQAIAPKSATNDEIRAHTGIRNHTAVYQDTQLLMWRRKIQGRQLGREWNFWVSSKKGECTWPAG